MTRSRHILAVVAVTAALCADRVVSAAPLPRTPVAEMAARLVVRLSESFSRTAPSDVRPETRCPTAAPQPYLRPVAAQLAPVAGAAFSPFQFRLPPPTV
jgi:hypothetical protein